MFLINNMVTLFNKEQLLNDNIKDWETMIDGNVKVFYTCQKR